MAYVQIVLALALLQFIYFGLAVGRARGIYKCPAPATTGNEIFERYFRVQMNTLELIGPMLVSLWLGAKYWSPTWAAVLGAVYLVGRVLYFTAYVRDPAKRGPGFGLTAIPNLVLVVGGLIGAMRDL